MNTGGGMVRRAALALAALGLALGGVLLALQPGQSPAGAALGWALVALGLPLSAAFALAGDALGPAFGGVLRERTQDLQRAAAGRRVPLWLGLLGLYLLLKVPVPLWPAGFPLLATLSTAALFLAALVYAAQRVGWSRAAALAAFCFGAGWGVEYLGSTTGFPFGHYTYAGAPGLKLGGVPLLVPLGWFALTLAATGLSGGRPWLAGLLLAAWDVGLEPLMTSQGFWTWQDPAPLWAGAPWQNFAGWWAVGTLLSWVTVRAAPQLLRRTGPDLSLAYLTELFFLPGGLLLLGQPGAAGVTLAAMLGAWGLAHWLTGRRSTGSEREQCGG